MNVVLLSRFQWSICGSVILLLLSMYGNASPLQKKIYNDQVQADASIYSAAVTVVNSKDLNFNLTENFGTNNVGLATTTSNRIDSIFRIYEICELWVAVAALQIIAEGKLVLNAPLDVTYTPLGATFVNPITQKPITVEMLLSHTSLMADVDFEQALQFKTSDATPLPTPVTFQTYAAAYFFSDPATKAFKPNLWVAGVTATTVNYFSYSRSNVLLLAFVLDKLIANQNIASATGLLDYITKTMLNPLAQADTFYEKDDGTFPFQFLDNARRIQDLKTNGTTPTIMVHPAEFVDYMMFSSVLDLSRVVSALFLDPAGLFFATGKQMLTVDVPVPDNSTTKRNLQVAQGQGVQKYDAAAVCQLLITAKYVSTCSMNSSGTNLWGWTSAGKTSVNGVLCTDFILENPMCVVVSHSYLQTDTPKSTDLSFMLAGASLEEAITLQTAAIGIDMEDTTYKPIFGFFVFLGVIGVFLFVPLAACLTEHIIQPAPLLPAGSANSAMTTTGALPQRKFDGI